MGSTDKINEYKKQEAFNDLMGLLYDKEDTLENHRDVIIKFLDELEGLWQIGSADDLYEWMIKERVVSVNKKPRPYSEVWCNDPEHIEEFELYEMKEMYNFERNPYSGKR